MIQSTGRFNRQRLAAFFLAAFLAGFLAACSNSTPSASIGGEVELLVSAAASLTDPLAEVKSNYEETHPNITITYNLGASGALQQQIEQGAPVDLFFSAGKKQMVALTEKNLIRPARNLLENRVVLIIPKGEKLLSSFEELADSSVVRIGVGAPESVPAGQYTAEIFDSLNLTQILESKLVLAKDVREVLSWVETGNVDAGIVYETDAKGSDQVEIACTAPQDSHKPVVYPVAVLADSHAPEEADAFVDYLFSKEAGEIFLRYGFTTPASEEGT